MNVCTRNSAAEQAKCDKIHNPNEQLGDGALLSHFISCAALTSSCLWEKFPASLRTTHKSAHYASSFSQIPIRAWSFFFAPIRFACSRSPRWVIGRATCRHLRDKRQSRRQSRARPCFCRLISIRLCKKWAQHFCTNPINRVGARY
jgi:hypothetical protein